MGSSRRCVSSSSIQPLEIYLRVTFHIDRNSARNARIAYKTNNTLRSVRFFLSNFGISSLIRLHVSSVNCSARGVVGACAGCAGGTGAGAGGARGAGACTGGWLALAIDPQGLPGGVPFVGEAAIAEGVMQLG